jgi:hypothetical protein
MAIRIDGNQSTHDTEATRRPESAQKESPAAGPGKAAEGDRLEVSGTAQLLAAALQSANDAPALRPEAIERARELLRSGELGKDTQALAEAIVGRLIED